MSCSPTPGVTPSSRLLMTSAALAIGACAYPIETENGADTASTTQALWEIGAHRATDEWDSGRTNNLSAWRNISCYSDFGDEYLLTGLKVFKDAGSTDQYIAKLVGECSGYSNNDGTFIQDGRRETAEIYTSNHKTPGDWVTVGAQQYLSGVNLTTDTWNDFVQLVRLEYVMKTHAGILGSSSSPGATGAVGWSGGPAIGPQKYLRCPDQHVATAFDVKYDTTNGKIRRAKLTCRQLSDE